MLSDRHLCGSICESVTSKNLKKPCCLFSLSPHLTSPPSSFSLSVICQAAQLLALSPPAQDPLDFFPTKELCTVPKPRLLKSARPFPFLSLHSFLPRLLFPPISTSLCSHCIQPLSLFRAAIDSSASFEAPGYLLLKFTVK